MVLKILSRYPISNPRVFGSAARGEDTEDSDLDILIAHDGTLSYFDIFRIEDEVGAAIGVRVELHTEGEFGERSARRIAHDLRAM